MQKGWTVWLTGRKTPSYLLTYSPLGVGPKQTWLGGASRAALRCVFFPSGPCLPGHDQR